MSWRVSDRPLDGDFVSAPLNLLPAAGDVARRCSLTFEPAKESTQGCETSNSVWGEEVAGGCRNWSSELL